MMSKRDEQAKETKQKIIESARLLIREKGIENVSVDDITKNAGVAKGSYYVYFKKKEDIIGEIGCLEFTYINEELEKMSSLNIVEKLKYYFKRYLDGITSLGVEINRSWLKNNLDCDCKVNYDHDTLLKILTIARDNNELKDDTNLEALTYHIISILYGLTLIWLMSGKLEEENAIKIELILEPYLK